MAGVGGQDTRTGKHKHASHTKGGTLEALVLDLLIDCPEVAASKGSIRPLFTLGRPVEAGGAKVKYFGSYLVRLAGL